MLSCASEFEDMAEEQIAIENWQRIIENITDDPELKAHLTGDRKLDEKTEGFERVENMLRAHVAVMHLPPKDKNGPLTEPYDDSDSLFKQFQSFVISPHDPAKENSVLPMSSEFHSRLFAEAFPNNSLTYNKERSAAVDPPIDPFDPFKLEPSRFDEANLYDDGPLSDLNRPWRERAAAAASNNEEYQDSSFVEFTSASSATNAGDISGAAQHHHHHHHY